MSLKRGAHVVVGTPGRVMDHIKRGTLDLGGVTCVVLDEADEMLRMGFVDDVEWILEQTPATTAGRAVLGDAAGPDPAHRAEAPARTGRGHDHEQDQHRDRTSASATGS